MKAKLLFLLKYYVYWVALSLFAKGIFMLYEWKDSATLEAGEVVKVLWKGLPLDLSLAGYILMLSSAVMALSCFFSRRVIRRVYGAITWIFLLFFYIVVVVDLELFRNWGYHIDTTPLMYLKTPQEAMASTPLWLTVCLLLMIAALAFGSWLVYKRWVVSSLHDERKNYWGIPVFLVIGGLMLIPVRGGFNVSPLNSSFVFFHTTNMYANQAAINPVWNFLYEVMHVDNEGSEQVEGSSTVRRINEDVYNLYYMRYSGGNAYKYCETDHLGLNVGPSANLEGSGAFQHSALEHEPHWQLAQPAITHGVPTVKSVVQCQHSRHMEAPAFLEQRCGCTVPTGVDVNDVGGGFRQDFPEAAPPAPSSQLHSRASGHPRFACIASNYGHIRLACHTCK